jgi:hypothetical protein
MKKVFFLLAVSFTLLLAGCFETTQEITINKNGSGTFSNTTDLSNLLALLKQMGEDKTEKIKDMDTTVSLAGISDSIPGLTQAQKEIINQATMKLLFNMDDEKFLIKLDLPFKQINDIQTLREVLPKISEAALKKLPGTNKAPVDLGNDDKSQLKSFDDFFDVKFTKKLISKTLNKEKYEEGKNGEYMKSLQQMSGMGGSPIKLNYVIHLPKRAKKVEGKAAKLSADKKTVTLSLTSDDFFNDPSKFEYRIKY